MTQEERADYYKIVLRAKKGDPSSIPRLREYLNNNSQLWKTCGNIALNSQSAWTHLIAGDNKHFQECIVSFVNQTKRGLADERTPILENLLVERVISSWLQVHYLEIQEAQQTQESLKWAEFQLKRLKAANDCYTKSIKELTTFKKLTPSSTEPQSNSKKTSKRKSTELPANTNGKAPETKVNGHNNGNSPYRLAAVLNGHVQMDIG